MRPARQRRGPVKRAEGSSDGGVVKEVSEREGQEGDYSVEGIRALFEMEGRAMNEGLCAPELKWGWGRETLEGNGSLGR